MVPQELMPSMLPPGPMMFALQIPAPSHFAVRAEAIAGNARSGFLVEADWINKRHTCPRSSVGSVPTEL